MKRSILCIVLAVAVLGVVNLVLAQGAGEHVMVKPTDVKWTDAPPVLPAGTKIAWIEGKPVEAAPFTFRLKMPANNKIAPHWHPAIEHVTVLSGTFNIGMGEKFDAGKLTAMPAGSLVIIPPKTPHFVQTKEELIVQVHGVGPWGLTYVTPEDDPSKKKQ
jgi:quercetin dioxygenase-like cupin family protein